MSKTTILGILSIVSAVLNAGVQFLQGHPVDYAATMAAVLAGIGLVKAQDQNAAPPKA